MDALVESTAAGPVIRAWQQFKLQSDRNFLHSAESHDPVTNWHEFMTSHQRSHQQFIELARHSHLSAEDAWTVAKNVEPIPHVQNVSLMGMADYLTRLVEALRSPEPALGTGERAREASAETTVAQCFTQAGLWWVIVFFFALVVLIVGVVVSGGGLAAVAAGILGILIGAGIQATLGGVIALVICLGGSVDIEINY